MTMYHMFNTITAGIATYLVKTFLGNRIDKVIFNYMSERRGQYAQILLYVSVFLYCSSYFDNMKKLDLNNLINAREFNGEIMMNIILKTYPHKVNVQGF